MAIRLGIAGATGAVGRIICEQLPEFGLPLSEIRLLASARSVGTKIDCGGECLEVSALSPDSIQGLDLLIASTPDEIALEIASWSAEANVTLIDESASHRMLDHVPLVVPEINPHHIDRHRGLIASPNCSTTQMVLCLKPLDVLAGIRRVIVSTYQAANGAGSGGERDLLQGAKAAINDTVWNYETFAKPLAFNVIPKIGRAAEYGYTSEEIKMVYETRKILDAPDLAINATCVRVPVVCGHSEVITVECERSINAEMARESFENMEGVTVIDDLSNEQYPTPLESSGSNEVFVGRIRDDISAKNSITFWCVSDNLRKGAATNALQIAKLLADKRLL